MATPAPIAYTVITDYQEDEDLKILKSNPNFKMVQIPIPDSNKKIYCF